MLLSKVLLGLRQEGGQNIKTDSTSKTGQTVDRDTTPSRGRSENCKETLCETAISTFHKGHINVIYYNSCHNGKMQVVQHSYFILITSYTITWEL